AEDYTPADFKRLRNKMIEQRAQRGRAKGQSLSKGVINQRMQRVRRLFRWGVGGADEQLVPPAVARALEQVPDLPLGRGDVRETDPVGPVDWARVKHTLPHLASDQLRTMVLLQWWVGMREDEVCALRGADIHQGGIVVLPPDRTIPVAPGVWS